MSLKEKLERLVSGVPDGGMVLLPVDHVRGWLEDPIELVDDLTLEEVAERTGRKPATVRGWCSSGRIPGAYKQNGRDWRITPQGFEEWQRRQREGDDRETVRINPKGDLAAWRKL